MPDLQCYRYLGDIKKLIPAGYRFQKLFARDYKSYCKGPIIMFVISKMELEIDNLPHADQKMTIDFILENKDKPEDFWQVPSTYTAIFGDGKFAVWSVIDGVIYNKETKYATKDEDIMFRDGFRIDYSFVLQVLELLALGGLGLI